MHLHINHVFCTDSNWGGTFDCRYMVCLDTLKKVDTVDSKKLLVGKSIFDQKGWDLLQKRAKESNYKLRPNEKQFYKKRVKTFNPEVLRWLEKNVKGTKDKDQPQGWCVGSNSYQVDNHSNYIWFVRRKDAWNFVKEFSVHKNFTTYFDYFKEVRKELDFKSKKLKSVDNYSTEIERSIYD